MPLFPASAVTGSNQKSRGPSVATGTLSQVSHDRRAVGELKVPIDFDLDDFDHDFDDDFEAEISGEYELQDDEYVRALLDIVDFEIEGLEAYRDDNE